MKNNIRAVCETQKRLNLDYHLQKNTSNKYAFDNNFVEDRGHKLVYCFHEKVTNSTWVPGLTWISLQHALFIESIKSLNFYRLEAPFG